MFFVVMMALLLMAALISVKYEKNMMDSLPLVTAGLILVMYLLSFFRGLGFLGWISILVVVFVIVMSARQGRDFLIQVLKKILNPGVVIFGVGTILVTLATSSQVFTWWDDINYWSSDAKQLFYMKGFPGKYGNVSPEFGDYPPVTSLAKWLFLQLGGSEYNESLQFAGYFFLNGIFLLPLLGRFLGCVKRASVPRWAQVLAGIIAYAAVMLFPGVFNGIIYYGTPADITMAIVYGALLLAIADYKEKGDIYYFTRIALYTAVLLMCKNVGFEWAIFALLFYVLFGRKKKLMIASVLFAGGTWMSWLLFCFVNRRVAKLTGAGLRMATSGNYTPPDNTADKLGYFTEGFWLQPMHADHNLTLDLSTGAVVVLIFLAVFVLYKIGIYSGKELKKLVTFLGISAIVSYGIVFVAHITIFQTEEQYLDAYAMAVSIARYCAPFALGSIYLIMGQVLDRAEDISDGRRVLPVLCACLLLICLTADYKGVYNHLIGYRDSIAENEAYVSDMVGDDGRIIASAVDDHEYWGKRVLVMRDGHQYYWVHNTYISKEASPVALVYDSYLAEEDTAETILKKLQDSHAPYFYVEDAIGDSVQLFSQIMSNGEFEPGKVYNIEENVY